MEAWFCGFVIGMIVGAIMAFVRFAMEMRRRGLGQWQR